MNKEIAEELELLENELEWLRYFYDNCDFGPAHNDVVDIIKENFIEDTGKMLPEGYEREE